jgi:3-oxoacyl-[acyl-carrier protein] reductase
MIDFENRVALVTGAGRGIGRAVALALARAGADVAVNYRTRAADALEVCSEIARLGRHAVAVPADVSDRREVTRLIDVVERELGGVSILVNNGGIARPRALEKIAEEDWDATIDTNLKSVFLVTEAVLPAMRARRSGRIINLSCVAPHLGGVVGPHDAASRAGILGLTQAYAALLAKDGITVNAIAPTRIDTAMPRGNARTRAELVSVARSGAPEEVADIALMLAGNGDITGQTLHLNGGWSMP